MSVAKNLLFIENNTMVPAFTPSGTALSADTNGLSIDRQGYETVGVGVAIGDISGTPTATNVQIKVQDSSDQSTWTDYAPDGTTIETTGLTADDTNTYLRVDLSAAKRYIRFVAQPNFTGGTSPSVPFTCMALLADRQRNDLFDAASQYTQTFTQGQ